MYKANGEYIKSNKLYETFTDITPLLNTLTVSDTNVQQSVQPIVQQMNKVNDVVRRTGETISTVDTIAQQASTLDASGISDSVATMPEQLYQNERRKLQRSINILKKMTKDDVFTNKNNIIILLQSLINDKIEKISDMNKDDTYKLFRNLISILQQTDYMLNDLERLTPRLKKIMELLGTTSNTIY